MGIETKRLQQEIRDLLKQIGISQANFIRGCYDLSEEEISPKIEKFKKQLQRSTTKPTILQEYIETLYKSEEYKKLGLIKLQPKITDNNFPKEFLDSIKDISKYIDECMKDQEDDL